MSRRLTRLWNSPVLPLCCVALLSAQLMFFRAYSSSFMEEISVEPPDGRFHGYPVHYREGNSTHSSVQCVGDNFEADSWTHRSCSFRHLCFDTEKREFLIFKSPLQTISRSSRNFTHFSGDMDNNSVALGGLNKKWNWDERGIPRLRWFPKVLDSSELHGYYELPSNVVLIPFHSFAGFNPGHLLWDDFLPIYTLLRIFQLPLKQLLLMRIQLDGEPLWASCEFNKGECLKMYAKFSPLMGVNVATNRDFDFTTFGHEQQSKLVCARQAAAGIGRLTDHGTKEHGWEPDDYQVMHNSGRGPLLWDFRNYMINNLGLEPERRPARTRIVFSTNSSKAFIRRFDFNPHIAALKEAFPDVLVETVVLSKCSLEEQVRLMSKTTIFVSAVGGSAVTATFLPQGATLILYYLENDGVQYGAPTGLPARLDWDIFNNMGYIRTHWLPGRQINRTVGLFVDLIRQELEEF